MANIEKQIVVVLGSLNVWQNNSFNLEVVVIDGVYVIPEFCAYQR